MRAPVTALYAALLTVVFLVLSVRVIARRSAGGVSLGVAGVPALERAARVHANFAEYVPLALLTMLLVESAGYSAWLVHVLGVALLVGRASHAFGVSRAPEDFRFRVSGIALTLTVLGTAAFLLLMSNVLGLTV